MKKQLKQLTKLPKPKFPTLDDFQKTVPQGGLLDPKLREGFGENFDVGKLKKKMLG